ncbi:MAG: hypothetical protein ACRC92_11435 [Peptostreptococcaceae bacterium]
MSIKVMRLLYTKEESILVKGSVMSADELDEIRKSFQSKDKIGELLKVWNGFKSTLEYDKENGYYKKAELNYIRGGSIYNVDCKEEGDTYGFTGQHMTLDRKIEIAFDVLVDTMVSKDLSDSVFEYANLDDSIDKNLSFSETITIHVSDNDRVASLRLEEYTMDRFAIRNDSERPFGTSATLKETLIKSHK